MRWGVILVTNPGGGSVMFGKTTSGPMYVYARRWRTSAAPPSVTCRPVYREVLEQTPLVRRGRRDREGDARVSAEIPQLPLIRQCRQDDLIPLDSHPGGRDLRSPSSSIVTTCATASLSRSSRAVSGRGIPAIGGSYPVRVDGSDGYQAATAQMPSSTV